MTCDICHEPVTTVLDCGPLPLANGYAQPDRLEPLVLDYCKVCNLYQLQHRVNPDHLFGDYAYRSACAGQTHFDQLAMACNTRVPWPQCVVDIGGNDGTLLSKLTGVTSINVDPYAPAQVWPYIKRMHRPWGAETASALFATHGPAQLITATNAFAHLTNLHDAATGIATLLDLNGWCVIQAPWSRDTFLYDQFDTLYHEHIYTLGVRAMRALFQRHWMDVHDVEYLPNVHGGTLRYWIRHGNDGIANSVRRLEDIEMQSEVHQLLPQRYGHWQAHEQARFLALPQNALALGAPAKATMYWAMTGTAQCFARVFDDAEPKWGKRVPGTNLTVGPFSAFPKDTTAPVVAMAWNARSALTKRVRELGYTGLVL